MAARTLRTSISLAAAVALAACASPAGGGAPRSSGDVLTQEELAATGEVDLYRVIERLRPRWLRARGQTSVTGGTTVVTLFVDGSPRGDVSQMRGMRVSDVLDITFLSASEAAFRFGTLAGSGGAVAIRTGR